ncbi:MAG: MobC family plasmid mobilization relaxosome protein [Bacillus sp. (in: Bacteria)]|nr:MobC family plasmid mobilization relaxosome protein [Bacillus sp. (in: firmicutes)]MCM1424977.1 MobC family plasmid mobilization relaxosome protein [Eubacterium sp.]
MKNKDNRFRDRNIHIMATDYEYQLIKARKEEAGATSLQEYIIEIATNGFIIKVDYSDLKNLAYEINKIGININQIAHKINSENNVYKAEIEEVKKDMDKIWKMIRAKFYQVP